MLSLREKNKTKISLNYPQYPLLSEALVNIKRSTALKHSVINQLLQLCTACTDWSDSVIRSETSSITESDRSGPIRYLRLFRSFSVNVLPW